MILFPTIEELIPGGSPVIVELMVRIVMGYFMVMSYSLQLYLSNFNKNKSTVLIKNY